MPPALTLSLRRASACEPWTCSVVFRVSTGVSAMRQLAPPKDANAVCVATGMFGRELAERDEDPVFAAVSPNRLRGFWMIAERDAAVERGTPPSLYSVVMAFVSVPPLAYW